MKDQRLAEELLKSFSAHWTHQMKDAKPAAQQALNKILYHLKLRLHMSQWETSFEKANGLTEATAAESSTARTELVAMEASALVPVLEPERPKKALEVFEIAGTGIPWNDFLEHRARFTESKKWIDVFKVKFRDSLGGKDTEVRVNGQPVATVVSDGIFAYKKFTEENPHLADQYTRFVTEKKLDTKALEADHPHLFEQYRATSVRLKK